HETLGPLYRVVSDLSMPHFGSTLLLAGADSSPDRIAVTFGDRDFHLGMAELALGWLLMLGAVQLETLGTNSEVLPITQPGKLSKLAADARKLATRPDRCRIDVTEIDGAPRYLVHNFRRAPSAAPKRYLL